MAIAVRSASSADSGWGNTAATVPVPAGTAAGDLLVLFEQVSKESSAPPSVPAGFTQAGAAAAVVNSGACGASIVSYRVATASEPASYTISSTGGGTLCPIMLAVTGANTAAPFDVTPSWVALAYGATSLAAPSITVSSVGALLLCGFGDLYGNSAPTWTAPSGMALQATSRSGNYNNSALFSQVLGGAGATGTRTATASAASQQSQAMSLAIAAAPVAPPVNTGQFFL